MKCLWIIAVLYVVCVVMRLARFNIENGHDTESHLLFHGLPSPAAAGAIASVAILWNELRDPPLQQLLAWLSINPSEIEQGLEVGLPFATIAVAILMVSNIPYPHVANQSLSGQRSFSHVVKVIFAAVTIVLLRQLALPIMFWMFALSSPAATAWKLLRYGRMSKEPVV